MILFIDAYSKSKGRKNHSNLDQAIAEIINNYKCNRAACCAATLLSS